MECDTCRAKAGSPTLCLGCLNNRYLIKLLVKSFGSVFDSMNNPRPADVTPISVCEACYKIEIGIGYRCEDHPGIGR